MTIQVKCWRNSIGSNMDRRDVRLVSEAASGPSLMVYDLGPKAAAELIPGACYTVRIEPAEGEARES